MIRKTTEFNNTNTKRRAQAAKKKLSQANNIDLMSEFIQNDRCTTLLPLTLDFTHAGHALWTVPFDTVDVFFSWLLWYFIYKLFMLLLLPLIQSIAIFIVAVLFFYSSSYIFVLNFFPIIFTYRTEKKRRTTIKRLLLFKMKFVIVVATDIILLTFFSFFCVWYCQFFCCCSVIWPEVIYKKSDIKSSKWQHKYPIFEM